MIRISGRLRQTSTQMPAGTLTKRRFEILMSARRRPKMREKIIPITAISRLTRKPSIRNRKLLPVQSHSQFPESNR